MQAAKQDEKHALALYRWNLQLTSAFQELLSVTEVVLRNAMDRELQKWNIGQASTSAGSSWLLNEPATPLRSLSAGKRKEANKNALAAQTRRDANHWRHGQNVTHDDVLAQVMFGMWKDLLPNHVANAGNTTENANRERLWREALVFAFPHHIDPDGAKTFWLVYRLHGLRNRVSHMETLLDVDAAERSRDIFTLVRAICPPTHDWLTGLNRVPVILKTRPSA